MSYIKITDILIWSQLKYFTPNESWGNYEKMDVRLLWNLEQIRKDLARPINIHNGYETDGHAPKSFHKLGMATDFHIKDTKRAELYNLYCYLLTVWHGGIGVYPYWSPCPGFHLDIGPSRTWVRDKEGKYYSSSDKIQKVIEGI